MPHEVYITGLGTVCPAGNDTTAAWKALAEGRIYVDYIPDDISIENKSARWGGCIRDFIPPSDTDNRDRVGQYALAAAEQAIAQSGLDGAPHLRRDMSLVFGTSKGGLASFTSYWRSFYKDDIPSDNLLNILADITPDAPARLIAQRLGIGGSCHVPVAACTTGLTAIIQAAGMVASGQADRVLCGSADASLHPLWQAAFERMGVLADAHPQLGPSWAGQPFDRHRRGFVLGEGAGAIMLESGRSIGRRNALPLARLRGWAWGTDPAGLTKTSPDGQSLGYVAKRAWVKAGGKSELPVVIWTHGTGTRLNDPAEICAMRSAFGVRINDVPIVAIKGAIGHLLGASGSVETTLAVQSLIEGTTPGHSTLQEQDQALGQVHIPRQAFQPDKGPILKLAMGFGGHLSAIVLDHP